MRAPHIVPLSRQAVETLKELRPLSGNSPFLFPSKGTEGYMSNNTMLYALYRMGYHRPATVRPGPLEDDAASPRTSSSGAS